MLASRPIVPFAFIFFLITYGRSEDLFANFCFLFIPDATSPRPYHSALSFEHSVPGLALSKFKLTAFSVVVG